MDKAKKISALWSQIKPQIGELIRLCHEAESHYEVTADAYQRGYKEAYDTAYADAEEICESGKRAMYQKGLKDAWECARKFMSEVIDTRFRNNFMVELFECDNAMGAMKVYSASEAVEKIRQYEQEKEEEIQVGDEVVGTYTGEEETEPFVIIRKIPEIYPNYYFGIYSKSGEFCQGGLKLKKTGRHFPEIATILEKMREESNG